MAGRITLRDIAEKAGVHFTTVSLALRNHPRIPVRTRQRIQRIARELGYRPDPHLSALSAYRQSRRPSGFQASLAWVTNHPTCDGWQSASQSREYHAGARERAEELGYTLEAFWLRAPRMTPSRVGQILRTKNITGLLMAPQPAADVRIDLDWTRFCAVTFGYGLRQPKLPTVSNHQYHSGLRAVSELLNLGYSRIGLMLSPDHDEVIDHQYTGAYYGVMQHRNPGSQLPVLFVSETADSSHLRATFLEWVNRHEPDAILTMPYYDIRVLTAAAGLRIPRDIGVAFLNLIGDMKNGEFAGMAEPSREVGAAAVDHLVSMINHDRRGIPATQNLILVESQWTPGKSVRRPND